MAGRRALGQYSNFLGRSEAMAEKQTGPRLQARLFFARQLFSVCRHAGAGIAVSQFRWIALGKRVD